MSGKGSELISNCPDEPPKCPHGPTLLFEKYGGKSGKTGKRFYACSAFRDRKDCAFFQWADKARSSNSLSLKEQITKDSCPGVRKDVRVRLKALKKLKASERSFCHTCGVLLLPSELDEHGNGHDVISSVSNEELARPTTLFKPFDSNKTYAQYLFGSSSVHFTVNLLRKLGFTKILCLGAPRIHEDIQVLRQTTGETMKSHLLDLDHRFGEVWAEELFSHYNMFNHHFFGVKEHFDDFMTGIDIGEKLVVVMDPPFGGMVEALGLTLQKISKHWHKTDTDELCPVVWFFPYFMEKRIQSVCPSLIMLDYKVDYDNHSLFHGGEKGRKEGSPVRIFTNLTPAKVELPKDLGYWFCDKCQRYSSPENWHCEKCVSCTSKDGKAYIHCEKCERCVKPSRVHCANCQQCVLHDHVCGQILSSGCHICGDLDHKRRDCPKKHQTRHLKRSAGNDRKHTKKRKK